MIIIDFAYDPATIIHSLASVGIRYPRYDIIQYYNSITTITHTTHNSQLGEGAFKDMKAAANTSDNFTIVPIQIRDEVLIKTFVCGNHILIYFVGFLLCHFRNFEQRSKPWDLLNWSKKKIQLNYLSRTKITSASEDLNQRIPCEG